MLTQLYRKYIPANVRDVIFKAFLGHILRFFRKIIDTVKMKFIFLFQKFLPDTEENRMYAFMGKYGVTPFPYHFILEYKNRPVNCRFDAQLSMYYVVMGGGKLYFPKNYSKTDVIKSYRWLSTEQDYRSPHLYVADINRLKGKIILEIGAAEAMFSLSAVEIASHIYLFECNGEWLEALNATFADHKDKVTVIRKYVSDINDDNNITLDRFLEDKDCHNLFLKMDIEGYEQKALKGFEQTLRKASDLDFAICTYHKENDAAEILATMNSYGFDCEFTDGYFYVNWGGEKKGFRKAVIRRNLNK